jgi:hypothetical protein
LAVGRWPLAAGRWPLGQASGTSEAGRFGGGGRWEPAPRWDVLADAAEPTSLAGIVRPDRHLLGRLPRPPFQYVLAEQGRAVGILWYEQPEDLDSITRLVGTWFHDHIAPRLAEPETAVSGHVVVNMTPPVN